MPVTRRPLPVVSASPDVPDLAGHLRSPQQRDGSQQMLQQMLMRMLSGSLGSGTPGTQPDPSQLSALMGLGI